MAELTTIARPYAEAAFELAREQNALPVWSEMLRFATTIVADERVTAALENPRLSTGDKEALLLSIAGDRISNDGRSFLRVLIEADRIALLPQIRELFDQLKDDTENVAKAKIETALPMSAGTPRRRIGVQPLWCQSLMTWNTSGGRPDKTLSSQAPGLIELTVIPRCASATAK